MTPIFLIAGSPGVGKTTISKALAGRFAKSMHIPVDDIRFMVVSEIQQPSQKWGEGLIEQLEAASASVCGMALRYRSVGFAITIDDFWDTYSLLAEYQELLATPKVYRITGLAQRQTILPSVSKLSMTTCARR
jgi:nucleoside-triphosphatase THEP1